MLKCRVNPLRGSLSRLAAMRRLTVSLLAICLSGVLISCGEEDAQLLPGETAREITANLDTVQALSDEGDCSGAEVAAQQVGEQIEGLGGVDPKLQQALREGAVRLNEVVATCAPAESEETVEETLPEPTESSEEKPKKDEKKEKEKEDDEEEAPVEVAPEETPSEASLPPQAEGKAKGHEKEDGEAPSGGISPGAEAEGGEG
jgi:hypothetical protein